MLYLLYTLERTAIIYVEYKPVGKGNAEGAARGIPGVPC